MSLLSRRSVCAGAVALAAALVPAAAAAAAPGNPMVVRIDPTTGVPKPLAGGAPWTTLGGIAFGSTGTLYVANQGPLGPNPRGAGIYSLTAPAFAITPLATTAPTAYPAGLVASGSTLYSLDQDRVLSIGLTAPSTQQVVSSGGLYDQYGVQPRFGALSGNTLYTTASTSCASAEGGGAYVIAVDTMTGAQTLTKSFGCTTLGGIAVTPAGNLLIAKSGKPAKIVQLNPQTGAVTTMSSGGSLKTPQGIALDPAGDLIVADSTSGVIAVSGQGGQQSPLTARNAVGGPTGIAIGADNGIYVSEAGVPPTLTASAASRQRFRSAGIALTVACNRKCTVGYGVTLKIPGATGFSKTAAISGVRARRTGRIKLPAQVNRRITRALGRGKAVSATITAAPQDPRSGARGTSTKLRVRLDQRAASSSRDIPSRPSALTVLTPSRRKSRARTTEAIAMTASIVGVGTPMRAARSARKINE